MYVFSRRNTLSKYLRHIISEDDFKKSNEKVKVTHVEQVQHIVQVNPNNLNNSFPKI